MRLAVSCFAVLMLFTACGGQEPDTSDLAPPTELTVMPMSGGGHLIWKDNSPTEESFEIERKDTGEFVKVVSVPFDSTQYHDGGPLTPGVTYTWRVRAVSSDGASSYSNEVSLTIPTEDPQPSGLAAPSGLMAMPMSGGAHLMWRDNSSTEDSFEIQRKDTGEFAIVTSVAANSTAYHDPGLTSGVTYTWRVRAVSSTGESDYSNEVTLKAP